VQPALRRNAGRDDIWAFADVGDWHRMTDQQDHRENRREDPPDPPLLRQELLDPDDGFVDRLLGAYAFGDNAVDRPPPAGACRLDRRSSGDRRSRAPQRADLGQARADADRRVGLRAQASCCTTSAVSDLRP
jgi:hypothetical protein